MTIASLGLMLLSFFLMHTLSSVFEACIDIRGRSNQTNNPDNKKPKVAIIPRIIIYLPLIWLIYLFISS